MSYSLLSLAILSVIHIAISLSLEPTQTPDFFDPTPSPDFFDPSPSPDDFPSSSPADFLDRPFNFDSRTGVRLQASSITVTTPNGIFSPTVDVEVSGDPGFPPNGTEQGYKSLELTWLERRTEMHIFIYLRANTTHWWSDEIRTYNGLRGIRATWLFMNGLFFATPLGQPFTGDFDEESLGESFNGDPPIIGRLTMTDIVFEAFLPRETSCVPGASDLHLERSYNVPIQGEAATRPGTATGYAFTVEVLDGATCEPANAMKIEFVAESGDTSIADVAAPVYSPSWALGQLYVSVGFLSAGETTISIQAVSTDDPGVVLASLEVPVLVTA